MKNSVNLVFVALLFVVLGCSCPKLQELANKQSSTPSSTPVLSNTASSPSNTNPGSATKNSGLTLEKYNQIKNGMSYQDVVNIVGSEGSEIMSSGEGKYKVTSYQWKGDDFKYLNIVLMGDKVTSKTQANLE